MNGDTPLSRALHDLSDVPGPDGMADKALRRARTQRTKKYATSTAGALAAVAAIAAPFLLGHGGSGSGGASGGTRFAAEPSPSPSAATTTMSDGCKVATGVPGGIKKVAPENWPAYVRATVDRLPTRTDYVMQSGIAEMCNGELYTVVNLGESRQAGHITVRLTQHYDRVPADCAHIQEVETNSEAPATPSPFRVLFCQPGNGFKLVYGIDDGYNEYRVYAIYPDNRTVEMEALGTSSDSKPVITAEQLRTVVTDPAMLSYFG